jgi:hypothetical protein
VGCDTGSGVSLSSLTGGGLEEVPAVVVTVEEDGDVRVAAWGLEEAEAAGLAGVGVAVEVVGVEEEEDRYLAAGGGV